MAKEKVNRKRVTFRGWSYIIFVVIAKVIPTKSKVIKKNEVPKKEEGVQNKVAAKKDNPSQSFFPFGTEKWKGIHLLF